MELLPEIEVWYALPAIRRKLAQALLARGLTQNAIADKLGIGASAVSQYLSGKRGSSDLPETLDEEFSRAAERIASGARDDMIREIVRMHALLRETRVICQVHRQHSKDVPEGCSCCFD